MAETKSTKKPYAWLQPLKPLARKSDMKITKLEKKKRLYLLETDQDQKIYITEDTIVRFFLSKDKEITEEQLKEIQTFAQKSYGKNLALYHLSFKQRTKKEVSDYLHNHEIDASIIPSILSELEVDNWINDQAYTRNMLDQNQLSGDKGPHILQQKLGQKGIEKQMLNQLIAEYDFSEVAERVAKKMLMKYQAKLPHKALKDKLTQNLMTKGFSYPRAQEAIAALEIESDHEQEEDLIYKELDKQHRKYSKKYEGYDLQQRLIQSLARKGYDYDLIKSALRDYM